MIPFAIVGLSSRGVFEGLLQFSYAPIERLMGDIENVVETGKSMGALEDDILEARRHLLQAELARERLTSLLPQLALGVAVFSLLMAALLSWLWGRSVSKPIEALSVAMKEVEQGSFHVSVKMPVKTSSDEMSVLIEGFPSAHWIDM
jgi:methyl-accepting chemotaxis protein